MSADSTDEKRLDAPRPKSTVVRTDRLLVLTTAGVIGLGLFVFLYIVNDRPPVTPAADPAQPAGSPVAPTDPRGYDLLTRVAPEPEPAPARVSTLFQPLPMQSAAPAAPVDQEAEQARKASPAYTLRRRNPQAGQKTDLAEVLQGQQALLAKSVAALQAGDLSGSAELGRLAQGQGGGIAVPVAASENSVETNLKFARSGQLAAGDDGWSRQRLQQAKSPFELKAGSVINATLLTALQSDLPGDAVAQVSADLRDSIYGTQVLVPMGTRLLGRTNSAIGAGQDRLQIVWTRLILPNGAELQLDSLAGADRRGAAGIADRVDYHLESVGLGAVLSTVLAVGGNLARGNAPLDRYSTRQAAGDSIAQSVSAAGSRIVERQLNIPPTITIREGTPVTAIVTRSIVLPPYRPNR